MNERLWDCHIYCLYRGLCNHMRKTPLKNEIRVAKQYMAQLPNCFVEINPREPGDNIRQYRGPFGIHVREYANEWVFRRDQIGPEGDLLGHQFQDAPHHQILGSLVATAMLYSWACAKT